MASARPNGRHAQGQSRSAQGLAVSHVRLENWRNFGRVDVALQRRAFLVGPNAAGKSNMLDVFRFLADLVSVGEGSKKRWTVAEECRASARCRLVAIQR